jgi:hypothetical protein
MLTTGVSKVVAIASVLKAIVAIRPKFHSDDQRVGCPGSGWKPCIRISLRAVALPSWGSKRKPQPAEHIG